MKEKSTLVLSLGESALSHTRQIYDDYCKSARDIWKELKKIKTATSEQAIQNLRNNHGRGRGQIGLGGRGKGFFRRGGGIQGLLPKRNNVCYFCLMTGNFISIC